LSNANEKKWQGVSAAIYGCAGPQLTEEERQLFTQVKPFGFILFARNCEDKAQVTDLVQELRATVGRDDAPVLIDQEGGRVARLKPPHWRESPPAGMFAELGLRNEELAKEAVYQNARLIAAELAELGINVDCAPLLDIPVPGSHEIIGDRAFGDEVNHVSELGLAMCEGLLDGGVYPVIKHIPGHGRANADSHEELPIVNTPLEELQAQDFVPFKRLNHMPYAMTAHVLYTAIDAENVATFSPTAIRMIREEIGFEGVLMSDDFSMKALDGSFADRVKRTIQADCDLVLHCNGEMNEMQEIAAHVPLLSMQTIKRLEQVEAMHRAPLPLDMKTSHARLEHLLADVQAA